MTKPKSLPAFGIGVRITHTKDKRDGLITGPSEHGVGYRLIPVAVEGSTRKELWPEHMIQVMPIRKQLPQHGGQFKPPAGYPLTSPKK